MNLYVHTRTRTCTHMCTSHTNTSRIFQFTSETCCSSHSHIERSPGDRIIDPSQSSSACVSISKSRRHSRPSPGMSHINPPGDSLMKGGPSTSHNELRHCPRPGGTSSRGHLHPFHRDLSWMPLDSAWLASCSFQVLHQNPDIALGSFAVPIQSPATTSALSSGLRSHSLPLKGKWDTERFGACASQPACPGKQACWTN